jgi:hypothetical protein
MFYNVDYTKKMQCVSRWGEREGDVLDAVKTMDKSTLNFHKD